MNLLINYEPYYYSWHFNAGYREYTIVIRSVDKLSGYVIWRTGDDGHPLEHYVVGAKINLYGFALTQLSPLEMQTITCNEITR